MAIAEAGLVESTLERRVVRGPDGDIRVRDVIDRLQDAGVRVYVVGGTPRDWLSGRVSQDVDLSLDRDLSSVHGLLREAFRGIDPLVAHAERFGTLRWGDPEMGELDLNILRSYEDIKNGEIYTATFVPRSDLEADCRMRDFSINGLYYDCRSGELLDPLGCGLDDLRTGTLRLITHPTVLAVNHRTSFRILEFLARGYSPTPETVAYLDTKLDRDVQGMGFRLIRWITEHVTGRGGDLARFRSDLEGRVREPASREVLERVFSVLDGGS
jgi:hypothetical protein